VKRALAYARLMLTISVPIPAWAIFALLILLAVDAVLDRRWSFFLIVAVVFGVLQVRDLIRRRASA